MPVALVSPLLDAFADATRGHFDDADVVIDLPLAKHQHHTYATALAAIGFDVRWLPGDAAFPDGVFVEDTAVIVSDRAVVLRSAHLGRAGEAACVAVALKALGLDVVFLDRGTCDGGDVLVLGDRVVVGRSARTNAAGIAALDEALRPLGRPIVVVDVPTEALHLKCLCSVIEGVGAVVTEGVWPDEAFGGPPAVVVPLAESYAANVISLGNAVLVADGFDRIATRIGQLGLQVHPLAVSEIRKADGSLTCLSLRLEKELSTGGK